MFTFYKLEYLLRKKKIKKYQISKDTGISSRTLSNMYSNKSVTTYTLDKLCKYLHCRPDDIMEYEVEVEDEKC